MESSNMKNIVVLKNIPSNMVEEAIIIFKQNQKVKETELIEKSNKINFSEKQTKSKDYILKEAEMLVADYINKIENKKKDKNYEQNVKSRYRTLKIYSIVSSIVLIVSLIINVI